MWFAFRFSWTLGTRSQSVADEGLTAGIIVITINYEGLVAEIIVITIITINYQHNLFLGCSAFLIMLWLLKRVPPQKRVSVAGQRAGTGMKGVGG